jgi:hypothetical protein
VIVTAGRTVVRLPCFSNRPSPAAAPGFSFPEDGMNDREAMLAIQQELDGTEWTAETLERIAEILQHAGYRIRDLDDRDTRAEPMSVDQDGDRTVRSYVLATLQQHHVRDQIAAILKTERDFGDLTVDAVSDKDIHNACLAVAAKLDFSREVDLAAYKAALTALGEATRRHWGPVCVLTPTAGRPAQQPLSGGTEP